jgi:CheY-like chemotaxis protein
MGYSGPVPEPYRLLVVDDDIIAHEVVLDHLEGEPFIIEKATDWTSMSEVLFCEKPEVILLDLNLPGVTGESIASIIHDTVVPRPSVVLYSGREPEEIAVIAERVGAFGWLEKGCPGLELVKKLKAAAEACRKSDSSVRTGDSGMRRSQPPPRPHGFGSSAPPRSPSVPPSQPGSAVPARAPLPPDLKSVPPSMGTRRWTAGSDVRDLPVDEGEAKVLVAAPATVSRSMAQSRLVADGVSVVVAGTWRETLSALSREEVRLLLLSDTLEGLSPIRLRKTLELKGGARPRLLLWTSATPEVSQRLFQELEADGLLSVELSPSALSQAVRNSL